MKFSKQELSLIIELLEAKIRELENQLAYQADIIFDMEERGEDTTEPYYRLNELEGQIDTYYTIQDKLEELKEGNRYA